MAPPPNEQQSRQENLSSGDDFSSVRGTDGSVRSERSIPRNTAVNTSSGFDKLVKGGLRNLANARMSDFLADPATGIFFSLRSPSTQESVIRHTRHAQKILEDFDSSLSKHEETRWPPPSPIQAFPAHTRFPGEQPPYRLVDGVPTTQPLRGRRDTQTTSSLTPFEGGSEIPEALRPTQQHPSPVTATPPPHDGNFRLDFSTSKRTKGKAQKLLSLPPPDMQKTSHFGSRVFMSPSSGVPAAATSYQQFDQPPQRPLEGLGIPHISVLPGQSPALLPNNMVWQPDQGLFAQESRHDPSVSPFSGVANHDTSDDFSNSGLPYQLLVSTDDALFETMQSPSRHEFQTGPPQQYEVPAATQENFYDSTSSIPTLSGFGSSSSQTRSSPLDTSSNHSPPASYDAPGGGDQSQVHLSPSDILRIWEHEPEMIIPEQDLGDDDAAGDGKMPSQANDWEEWINYHHD